MRDPLSWSLPLFRAFGIQVRVHLMYILVTLGLLSRQYYINPDRWVEFLIILVVVLFIIVLLHEFGHCFAARREGGDAEQILMWPLGGLAFCDVPHSPRAHFNTAAGGPVVNFLICIACMAVLLPSGYLPPLNVFNINQLDSPQITNFMKQGKDGIPQGHESIHLVRQDNPREVLHGPVIGADGSLDGKLFVVEDRKAVGAQRGDYLILDNYLVWTARVFWLSWFGLLFNVFLPAYPLDGGRMLQAIVWARTDSFQQGTKIAVYGGFVTAVIMILISFMNSEAMLLALGIFIWVCSAQQYYTVVIGGEESALGYDFSQGYTSLEKDEPPPPKVKKPSLINRWLQARRDRRAMREAERRASDEARLDELLIKIQQTGKGSLTDEERRFMDRVSARYRNRS